MQYIFWCWIFLRRVALHKMMTALYVIFLALYLMFMDVSLHPRNTLAITVHVYIHINEMSSTVAVRGNPMASALSGSFVRFECIFCSLRGRGRRTVPGVPCLKAGRKCIHHASCWIHYAGSSLVVVRHWPMKRRDRVYSGTLMEPAVMYVEVAFEKGLIERGIQMGWIVMGYMVHCIEL